MKKLKIKVPELSTSVNSILHQPKNSKALLVLSHGAGAPMTHPFLEELAKALGKKNIATLRYNFHYMDIGKRAPDRPNKAWPVVRAAVMRGLTLANGLPVYAGGKSFGGRMTSQLASTGALSDLKGLIFFGFPLHPAGKPGIDRAEHLKSIKSRMLFLQGTRDTLAQTDLIEKLCKGHRKATLKMFDGADHSFKMLKSSGITNEEMTERLATAVVKWMKI